MSPVLPAAETLAGRWSVTEQGSASSCALELTLRPLANAQAADHDGRCLDALRIGGVTAWRPATDGIALTALDGRTLAFFSRESGEYVLRRADCPQLRLSRA